MPWIPELVDKWSKGTRGGLKQSEVIVKVVANLMQLGLQENGRDLFIVLTHSQQLAEVLRVCGMLEDPSIRFPELTMLAARNNSDLTILPRGILSEALEDES